MGAAEELVKKPRQSDSHLAEYFQASDYQIHQPFIQIMQESYTITSVDGSESFKAKRARQWIRTWVAKVLAATLFVISAIFLTVFFSALFNAALQSSVGTGLGAVIGSFLAVVVTVTFARFAYPKRKAIVTHGDETGPLLFTIRPTSGIFFFNHEYGVYDANNKLQVIFRKNFLENFIVKKWHCHYPNMQYRFTAREDSVILAFLRRYMALGRYIPLHFHFSKGAKKFGNFKRRFSLRDKYTLDFDHKVMPSWLAVATAILLDTGESR